MKKLIALLTLSLSLASFSTEAPEYLKGATITVTLKSGKTYTFKSEEYAVVPRSQMGQNVEYKDKYIAVERKIKSKQLVKNRKNRVFGMIGRGATGDMNVSTNGTNFSVEQDEGLVLGIGYQRSFTETLNLGIIIQNNKSTSISIGTDF